jgi:hypothetical protein
LPIITAVDFADAAAKIVKSISEAPGA